MATISARDGLLKGSSAPDCATYSIVPFDVNIDVSRVVVNKTETIAILTGKTLGDADTLTVRVLYLGKRDVANMEVPCVDLDPTLFGSFPGLDILDVQFHPDSEHHVVMLTSDRTLRVYNVEEPHCGFPAEQTFELRGRKRVFLDDEEDEEESELSGVLRDPIPVSFAYGGSSSAGSARDGSKTASASASWNRLAVLVSMSDGEVRPLCPVAPFGARYSGRFVASLLADDAGEWGDSKNLARIWAFKAFGVDDRECVDEQRKYIVAPHALEAHVARFPERGVGIRSNSPEDASPPSSQFRGIHTWPIASSVTGIMQTSVVGRLRTGVLLGDVVPAWTMNPPQCVFHGEDIVAVRSQSVQLNLFTNGTGVGSGKVANGLHHVVIDDIVLEEEPVIDVFRDPANPTSFVVAQQLAAHVISLPWISSLDGELPDVLPLASATELMRADRTRPAVCHALLGDKLSGSALFSILSDGTQLIYKIVSRIVVPVDEDASLGTVTANRALLSSHVKEMYAPIMSAPSMAGRKFISAESAESPDNMGAFVESVSDLRSQHVAFCHKAQYTIKQRINDLEVEVRDQLSRVEEITSVLHRVEKKQSDLKYLEEKTQWMANNVADRVQLLRELYWAVPKPRSEEEKRFQHVELPLLESSTAALETEVNLLRSMAAKLKQECVGRNGRGQAGGQEAATVRMADLRHVREKLEDHQDAIQRVGGRLQAIERAIL